MVQGRRERDVARRRRGVGAKWIGRAGKAGGGADLIGGCKQCTFTSGGLGAPARRSASSFCTATIGPPGGGGAAGGSRRVVFAPAPDDPGTDLGRTSSRRCGEIGMSSLYD